MLILLKLRCLNICPYTSEVKIISSCSWSHGGANKGCIQKVGLKYSGRGNFTALELSILNCSSVVERIIRTTKNHLDRDQDHNGNINNEDIHYFFQNMPISAFR